MTSDCNNPKQGEISSMDRFSDLRDATIHKIMSYLDTKEAYRTNVLSKRWNQVFSTNPNLDFYHCRFFNEIASRIVEYIDTRMQKFSKDENLPMTKLILEFSPTVLDLVLHGKIDEWLEIAVRNQVEQLYLGGPADYKLPHLLFRAESLRRLDCHNLEIPYYEALDLVSLEHLVLGQVVIEERMLFHIVSSCPLLAKLVLSGCSGFKNIVIPRHSKLEDLYIDGGVPLDGKVILETSSLRFFQYNIQAENSWPIISDRGLLRNLRHLFVSHLYITDEALAELLQELTSLEKLVFSSCDMLMNVKISHTQLKHIGFYGCSNLLNVVIDAPNLTEFKFNGQIEPPLSIMIHSQANCTIDVDTMACSFNTGGFFILKKLLKGLNSCNVLKIFLFDKSSESEDDDDEEEEESGNAELGPPCDIEVLTLNMSYCKLSSSSLSAFLNGLFWTCHPRIISLRVDSGSHKLKVEPLVNKLEDMVKCLEHPLKRIQVEKTDNSSKFLDVQLRLCW